MLISLANPLFTGTVQALERPPEYPVLRVVDGDTILIDYNGKKEKIRLLNVDTPESVHPDKKRNSTLGKAASDYTRERLEGKSVGLVFENRKRGKYGRLLAYIMVEGENFNIELVKKGWSPYYTKYGTSPSFHKEFLTAQKHAKSLSLHIWGNTLIRNSEPRPIARKVIYHGNKKSRVFHNQACKWFNCKHCTRIFHTPDKALSAGFRPCSICRP